MAMAGDLRSVDSVVVDLLLTRKEAISASDLFVLCTRMYTEQLLPARLGERERPVQLSSLSTFTAYLRSRRSSSIQVVGRANDCEVRLLQTDSSPQPAFPFGPEDSGQNAARMPRLRETPEASDLSAASSTCRRPEIGANGWADSANPAPDAMPQGAALHSEALASVRSRLCLTILDFVLEEAAAFSYGAAVSLEEARHRCEQYLVRLALASQTTVQCAHRVTNGAARSRGIDSVASEIFLWIQRHFDGSPGSCDAV
jgi:hypothetical protein